MEILKLTLLIILFILMSFLTYREMSSDERLNGIVREAINQELFITEYEESTEK